MAKATTNKTQSVPEQEVVQFKKLNGVYGSETALRNAGFSDADIADLCTRKRDIPGRYVCKDNGVSCPTLYSVEELKQWITGEDGKRIPTREAHFRNPVIDGYEFKAHVCFLQSERDMYTFSPENSSCKFFHPAEDEVVKNGAFEELIKYALKFDDDQLISMISALKPASKKESTIHMLFNVDSMLQLKSKVTIDWIIYRGPNGERGSSPETFSLVDAVTAWGNSVQTVMTKNDVLDKVNKLKKSGLDVTASIIGL